MISLSEASAGVIPGARAIFTTKSGQASVGRKGASREAFSDFNLGLHVGDEDTAVRENRRLLSDYLGAPVAFVNQTHSARVAEVGPDWDFAAVNDADALVTTRRDVALAIMVADCMPILLADTNAGVAAAVHAGRVGFLGEILPAAIAEMLRFGALPENMRALIGPSMCGRCYEVPQQMHDEAVARVPELSARTPRGSYSLDLRAGARAQLVSAGLAESAIDDSYPCTGEALEYFSYRRENVTGRFVGAIRLL
ncbi:peptidoglycan editing factor PgeF [Dermabacteraceae bacterium TAE3-ERU27]|nr:peptidoglycan editing factor PgeF [Dermabacteraceae bacterium TAE3-ERU27]